jgi:hypothetical protein
MGYFRELPNIQYQSFLSDSLSSEDYLVVKNLFRRNKLRDDLQNVFTIFDKYEIIEGARPDTVAEEFYGDAELDWVVLMTAGILNVRDEWPLSNFHLFNYINEKYDDMNAVHHYETIEIKDSSDRMILEKGKIVNSDFEISYYDNGKLYTNRSITGINIISIENPIISITNWEYEVLENTKKSSIYLLKTNYLNQFLNDMRNIMTYQKSSEYINERMIRTENTRITST